jgi:hypothetical protein
MFDNKDGDKDNKTIVMSNCTLNKTNTTSSMTDESAISSYDTETTISTDKPMTTLAQAQVWKKMLPEHYPVGAPHAETIYKTSSTSK